MLQLRVQKESEKTDFAGFPTQALCFSSYSFYLITGIHSCPCFIQWKHDKYFGMMAHACDTSSLRDWGRRMESFQPKYFRNLVQAFKIKKGLGKSSVRTPNTAKITFILNLWVFSQKAVMPCKIMIEILSYPPAFRYKSVICDSPWWGGKAHIPFCSCTNDAWHRFYITEEIFEHRVLFHSALHIFG